MINYDKITQLYKELNEELGKDLKPPSKEEVESRTDLYNDLWKQYEGKSLMDLRFIKFMRFMGFCIYSPLEIVIEIQVLKDLLETKFPKESKETRREIYYKGEKVYKRSKFIIVHISLEEFKTQETNLEKLKEDFVFRCIKDGEIIFKEKYRIFLKTEKGVKEVEELRSKWLKSRRNFEQKVQEFKKLSLKDLKYRLNKYRGFSHFLFKAVREALKGKGHYPNKKQRKELRREKAKRRK